MRRLPPISAQPCPFDLAVGARVRQLRKERRLSLDALGTLVGVSAPQVQKYEVGINRIAVSILYRLAHALDVEITDLTPSLEEIVG